MHLRRFYIDRPAVVGSVAMIKDSDAHHIKTVLRLKKAALVYLLDAGGGLYEGAIKTIASEGVTVEVLSKLESPGESPLSITVAQALLKANKMDQALRHLTELGISRWIPFVAGRSVKKLTPDRYAARLKRWQTIAREAVKQSRRAQTPDIDLPMTYTALLKDDTRYDLKLFLWEDATARLQTLQQQLVDQHIRRILVLIGPEGGLSTQEAARAKAHGFYAASMGPRILRAETATLAAVALVQFLWGDMG